jgi:hypothetical protein
MASAAMVCGTRVCQPRAPARRATPPPGELANDLGGNLECQACLAHPAAAGQGHQLMRSHKLLNLGYIPCQSDERRALDGQVVGERVERTQRRKLVG